MGILRQEQCLGSGRAAPPGAARPDAAANQVQSLCRILGAGGPSMQGIALKYS